MSNIYVTEPPPSGRVVLETSRGDIEIELFAKECPKACKNFIALALEGYYDNVIWHRFLPDFIIQTGDPSGTGAGGESFYGEPFRDEIHSRLRFNRRGLLGMANGSERDTNESQFFLTLAPTPELQGKHTMFGRVVSNQTIYNLVALAESVGETDDDNRPRYPPKLKTVRVLENPFEGEIKLRITREERLAIQRNKREAEKRKQEREKEAAQGKQKKNTALLSFGEAEDMEDDGSFKGPKSSHDLLKSDKRLKAGAPSDSNGREKKIKKSTDAVEGKTVQDDAPPPVVDSSGGAASSLPENGVGADKAPHDAGGVDNTNDHDLSRKNAKKERKGRALLEQFRSAYRTPGESGKVRAAARDEETAKLLKTFQSRMRGGAADPSPEVEGSRNGKVFRQTDGVEELTSDMREYGEGDDDDEQDWRNHRFDFGGRSVVQDQHADDEYVTLDPRDSSGSAARQLGFGGREAAERAREERNRQTGRRGRDWVDERAGGSYRDAAPSNGRGRHLDKHRHDRSQDRDYQRHDRDRHAPRDNHRQSRDRSPPRRRDVER